MLNFLKKIKNKLPKTTHLELIERPPAFAGLNGNAYENDIFRSAVDAIARNIAKLKGSHVIRTESGDKGGNSKLTHLLQVRPNQYMSAYDFLYKMASTLWTCNNSFALLDFDKSGYLSAIYPLSPVSVQMATDEGGELFAEMSFRHGRSAIFRYSELIHLRRFFHDNEIFGATNGAISAAIDLAEAENETITSGIRQGANLRGLLKYTQILNDKDLLKIKERFVSDYLDVSNSGGLAALDARVDFIPLNFQPVILNADQSKAIRAKIFSYLGISEKIVTSSYDENEFSAFFESVIEPFALALSLEMTAKIFTDRERRFGNEIIFEASRLQFASFATKTTLIKELIPLGILTINQALDILNLPTVPDGDKRLQSLNFVQSDKILDYQLKEKE